MMKKILAIIIILAVSLWIGCTHDIPSSFSIDDLPAPPKAPTDLRIAVGDNTLGLTWTMASTSGITKYFIYRSLTDPDSVELYDSATVLNFTDEGVQNGLRYYYKISALSSDDIEGYPSAFASAVPGIFSINIDNDAEYTRARMIDVYAISPEATSHIMLSNSEDFSSSKWLTLTTPVSWELTEGDGVKTVYAKFKDAQGNETSETYSDNITLDTRAQIDTLYIVGGGSTFSAGDAIRFVLNSGETSGTATVEIQNIGSLTLYDNGSNGDAVANNGIYEFAYVVPPNTEVIDAAVMGNFTDRAGNQAPVFNLSYLVTISNPPIAPELWAAGAKEDQIDLAWVSPTIPDFNQYRLYRANNSGVSENSELITTISSQGTVAYTDQDLEPSTTYYYRLYVYDNSGLSAGSNVVNKATTANVLPKPVSIAIAVQDSTTFRLTWTRNSDTDFESYRIYRSTSSGVDNSADNLLVIENTQSTTSFTDTSVESGQTYYYKVFVYDRFGGSAGSNEVFAPK